MTESKTYTTAGAFRRALEECLKRTSHTDQTDIIHQRRQVSFDRLLARLFRVDSVPWVLKGGYALGLRFKTARSTDHHASGYLVKLVDLGELTKSVKAIVDYWCATVIPPPKVELPHPG